MIRTIRFHLDEHVNSAIADGLRARGVDVSTTAEVGLRGQSDYLQLGYTYAEGRVMITEDRDYLGLHANGVDHAGICYYVGTRRTIGEVIDRIIDIWEILEPDDVRNRVEYL